MRGPSLVLKAGLALLMPISNPSGTVTATASGADLNISVTLGDSLAFLGGTGSNTNGTMPSQPSLQALLIDDIAVADVVGVDGDTRMRAAQELDEPGFARFDRQPAQILAVDLKQVEGQS